MNNLNLKYIEKKIWQVNFEDGITDITIALVLIVTTICQILNEYRFGLYLPYIIPVFFSIFAKKRISTPRVGLVNYSKERNRIRHLLSFSITTIIFILLIFTISGKIKILQPTTPIIIGLIILLICGIIAFVLNYKRMYLYSLLITGSFAISELTIHKTGVISSGAFAWLISGTIILVIGTYYLFELIKKYPKPNFGENNV